MLAGHAKNIQYRLRGLEGDWQIGAGTPGQKLFSGGFQSHGDTPEMDGL